MTERNRKRLAEAVVARRVELGMLKTTELAKAAGLSARMLGDVENARRENWSSGARAQIERALEWEVGSIKRTLDGGNPTPLDRTPFATAPPGSPASAQSRTWAAMADMAQRLAASMRGQVHLYEWTRARLPESEHAEHERIAAAAVEPLMSTVTDYAEFTRTKETTNDMETETPAGTSAEAGQAQEAAVSPNESEDDDPMVVLRGLRDQVSVEDADESGKKTR